MKRWLVPVVLLAATDAGATTIDPRIWQELVVDADFVGIVECVTAGGIVAEYDVIESWKGAGVGTRFRVRIAVNYWEPQFPIALVGERFLITAFSNRPSSRMLSTTLGGGVPRWAREIAADYHTPLFQGVARLPAEGAYALHGLGTEENELERFRDAVTALLQADPEEREVRVLKALAQKYLVERAGGEPIPATILDARNAIESAQTLDGVLAGLRRLRGQDRAGNVYDAIVAQGGGAETLTRDISPDVARVIRARLGLEPPVPPAPAPIEARPSSEELDALERDVEDGFVLLARYRPEAVVRYLRAWQNPNDEWSDADRGYVLGSFFAIELESDRERHLAALLEAQDPFVRVAAAVYLTFENEDEGLEALRRLSTLDGDPGVWAALTRARRGDARAIPRMLRVFDEPGASNMRGVPHRNLQKRVLVLLSNSARAAGAPPPLPADFRASSDDDWSILVGSRLLTWWERYGPRIAPRDPWLDELRASKVD